MTAFAPEKALSCGGLKLSPFIVAPLTQELLVLLRAVPFLSLASVIHRHRALNSPRSDPFNFAFFSGLVFYSGSKPVVNVKKNFPAHF